METHITNQIGGLMESLGGSSITVKLPNEKWNDKWLKLQTRNHLRLEEMKMEVGRFCFEMWASPLRGRLLVLVGANGTGKTHCAKAVHHWLSTVGHGKKWINSDNESYTHSVNLSSVYWHWPELLDCFKQGMWDVLDDMISTPCLVLDELGGGHDPSMVGTDKLCQILSRREHKWTLVTTNVLPSAWEQVFDRRITSRFFRNSTLIDLSEVPDFNA